MPDAAAVLAVVSRARTQQGELLTDLCAASPVLLVFLRHAGCSFCRETLADLQASRADVTQEGARIVLVHLGDSARLDRFLTKRGLGDVSRIADRSQSLYRAFGLLRGGWRQLAGPKVLWRGFVEGVLWRHGLGKPAADASQMPGVFLIRDGEIARRFRHRSAADRPDYVGIVTSAVHR